MDTAKHFAAVWRVLGNTEERVRALVAELEEIGGPRPFRKLEPKFPGKCKCGHPIKDRASRDRDGVCYFPPHNGKPALLFHWACAPQYTVAPEQERIEAERRYLEAK